jgi:type II secretory pathway component PulF
MENYSFKRHSDVTIKSVALTVITHALLPLTLLPFAFFVVPVFAEKANELDFELDTLTLLVFKLASFINGYWYLYVLVLALLLTIDAVVILSLLRLGKIAGYFWSGLIVFIETGFVGLCVLTLVHLEHALSNIPWLCPI